MERKTCTKCGETKDLAGFARQARGRGGFAPSCRECQNTYAREWQRQKHGHQPRQPPGPTRRCPDCGLERPREEFKTGYCPPCNRKRARAWALANPERVRETRNARRLRDPEKVRRQDRERHKRDRRKRNSAVLLRLYGIGLDDYDAMLERQGGGCAVCGGTKTATDSRTGLPRRLHIDHDHTTGQVRGILCDGCNKGLGFFGDDPSLLRAAAGYVS